MSDITDLSKEVNKETPWWSAMPVLAASIVGVPSFIAIMSGWFIATHIVRDLKLLETYNLSELHQMNEQVTQLRNLAIAQEDRWHSLSGFIRDDLRAQYQTCLSVSKTDEQRRDCLTPATREDGYGSKHE